MSAGRSSLCLRRYHLGHDIGGSVKIFFSDKQLDTSSKTERGVERPTIVRFDEGLDSAARENGLNGLGFASGAKRSKNNEARHAVLATSKSCPS